MTRILVAYRFAAIGLTIASAPVTPAAAQESTAPLVGDRPDFTESTTTIEPGRIQLEAGYTLDRIGEIREHVLGELLVRIGISSRAEIRVAGGSYQWIRYSPADTSGFSDAAIGLKLRLADPPAETGRLRPAVSLLAATSVPTGSPVFRTEALQPEAKLAFAWALGSRFGMASNVGYGRPRAGDRAFDQLSASLSANQALSDRVSAYVEAYTLSAEGPDEDGATYLNGGFTFLVSNDLQLDLRAGRGLNHKRENYFFGAGLVRRW